MAQLAEDAAIDWSGCAAVEVNPRKLSGTPILKGSRMPAYGVVSNYRDGLSAEEIADLFQLDLEPVRAVIAYAVGYRSASAA